MPYGKIVVIKRGGGDGTEFPLTATCLFGRYGEQSFGEFASRLHYAIFNPLIVIRVECMFIDFTSISLFFGKCNLITCQFSCVLHRTCQGCLTEVYLTYTYTFEMIGGGATDADVTR